MLYYFCLISAITSFNAVASESLPPALPIRRTSGQPPAALPERVTSLRSEQSLTAFSAVRRGLPSRAETARIVRVIARRFGQLRIETGATAPQLPDFPRLLSPIEAGSSAQGTQLTSAGAASPVVLEETLASSAVDGTMAPPNSQE